MRMCCDLFPWILVRQIEYHTIFNQINLNKMFYTMLNILEFIYIYNLVIIYSK